MSGQANEGMERLRAALERITAKARSRGWKIAADVECKEIIKQAEAALADSVAGQIACRDEATRLLQQEDDETLAQPTREVPDCPACGKPGVAGEHHYKTDGTACPGPLAKAGETSAEWDARALLPCPFCGGKASIIKNGFPPRTKYRHPSCENDNCPGYVAEQDEQGGTSCDCTTDEQAIALWNQRAAGRAASGGQLSQAQVHDALVACAKEVHNQKIFLPDDVDIWTFSENLAKRLAAPAAPELSADQVRADTANIILRRLGFTNGWAIPEQRYNDLCVQAADEILALRSKAVKESDRAGQA